MRTASQPDNVGIIDVYVNTDSLGTSRHCLINQGDRKRGNKRREELKTMTGYLVDDETRVLLCPDLVIPSLLNLPLGGVPGIKQVYFQQTKAALGSSIRKARTSGQ